ncbi:hypothetical protein HY416_00535 [Candidatus Kaiserbacteria bacterium]|nr:hypothetical protein [Candidatus Kaiserbacteria bacterium]
MKKVLIGVVAAYLAIGLTVGGNEWLKDMATFDCGSYTYGGGSIFESAGPGCRRRGLEAGGIFSAVVVGALWGPLIVPRLLFPDSREEV